jgi:hypothetical protein
MMPWRTYGTEDLGKLAAHHCISGSQGARHRFQGSVKRIAADDCIRIKCRGGTLARDLDQL